MTKPILKKSLKKAQTELLGLAIVVVLLSLGLMLILIYSGKEAPSQLKEINEELADKFIHSMLDTTSGCDSENSLTIQDLIQDVVEYRPYGSITCADGRISYDYLNSTLESLINDTLAVWKPDKYYLQIYMAQNTPIYSIGMDPRRCGIRMGKQYVSTIKSTPIYIDLFICG